MTATHPVDREEVMAWLDGELSPVRAAEVTTHVGSCAECRSLADSFQQVSTDLAPWHVDAPPDHVIAPSLPASGRLERVAGPRDRWSWLTGRSRLGVPRWVFAAAPAVALLFIAVLSPGLERRGPTEMASARAEPVPPPSGPRAVAAAAAASPERDPFCSQASRARAGNKELSRTQVRVRHRCRV
jgi:anti-sigma factor RsiW